MVDFLRKRLQIFVSSTFTDLISERQSAVEAILTSGHIPAGMELFTSGDESQMEVIKQWIDESDVYLLILGGRYGSIETTSGKSYTQLEYEYAVSQSKPIFSCVITEDSLEKKVKKSGTSVIERDNPAKLSEFRNLVLSKMVKFWNDEKDIKISVGETLSHLARRDDLQGWVRPHQEANMPALVDEIARLSKENSTLRGELSGLRNEIDIHGLTFSEITKLLEKDNLIEPLIKSKELLLEKYDPDRYPDQISADDLDKLCLIGLVKKVSGYFWILSDEGRIFINKYTLAALDK